ncbi:MAG: hypothetical protein LAN64_16665 [Acidobacteriia bacterium]|nr:hypothetical protein [Terriglobia bacterium]
MAPSYPIDVLWCPNARTKRKNGWSFPPAVRKLLIAECAGLTVLHLFGGLADFGVRLDIDPRVKPDVIGDAWLPPFKRNAFDVVIIDPPYFRLNQQEKNALLRGAAWVARSRVVWFHTIWIAADRYIRPERAWLVRVGDTCQVRCLQFFRVSRDKEKPLPYFSRGPAMKYNRWLVQPQSLPFQEGADTPIGVAERV